jgi:hypothetical protein
MSKYSTKKRVLITNLKDVLAAERQKNNKTKGIEAEVEIEASAEIKGGKQKNESANSLFYLMKNFLKGSILFK